MTTAFTPFEASRPDGRSDVQVVFDMVKGAVPDTVFTYHDLAVELSKDTDRVIDVQAVRPAVYGARRHLLRKHQRYLEVVRGRGYRVVAAGEHLGLALRRKDESRRKWRLGRDLLEYTRLDEVEPSQRTLQMQVAAGFAIVGQAMDSLQARQDRQERVLDDLRERMRRLEQRDPHERSE